MEAVLAKVRGGTRLNTYDFVDVVNIHTSCGWSVKSTMAGTPVTWKRAKLPNQVALIDASHQSAEGLQQLGDAIIGFCNDHIRESFGLYGLNEIGYARLVLFPDGRIQYFERELCRRENPYVFDSSDFRWSWSEPKRTVKKEQLPALHGVHIPTNKKWWAWHGLGENQLHFSGEGSWWPEVDSPHSVCFEKPSESECLDFAGLLDVLASNE